MKQRQNKYIAEQWLRSIVNLTVGEELLLPAKNKHNVREMLKTFNEELANLIATDITATEIQLNTRYKDHRFWLVIKKVAFSPFVAFKKGVNGKVKRVIMKDSSERKRRLLLMKKDGYTLEEIEEVEGSLGEEDLNILK